MERLMVSAWHHSGANPKCSVTKGGARPGWTLFQLLLVGVGWRGKATPRWPLFFLIGNWESTPTLSRQINVHDHYWFKMNSLLYHERFISWHDWVCLTLMPLDHEICRLCNELVTTGGDMCFEQQQCCDVNAMEGGGGLMLSISPISYQVVCTPFRLVSMCNCEKWIVAQMIFSYMTMPAR